VRSQSIPHGPVRPYFVVAPELQVQSDWSRHALAASITGSSVVTAVPA
jgi:hypothetical protein